MPEVSLQSYGEEMRRLIAEGNYAQAIAIGRHILGLHPKHLHTYRILGEACLEQGDFAEAHGLFARALACDPEDLFARVGIAVVQEKRGNTDLAIWHLERAYELAPGNAELRKELQRLYAHRDGAARPRLKLTSGAVARLYARSGLWTQAIHEFHTLLEQNPDLLDIKVALADALWNAGQKKEAARVCQEILQIYPHCLKANLILGEIGLRGERESEGRALLQLAQEIDPENVTAQLVFGDRSPLPARMVKVPRLQDLPSPPAVGEVVMHKEEIAEEALPEWLVKTPVEPSAEPLEESTPEMAATEIAEEEFILAPEGEEIAVEAGETAPEEEVEAADEIAEESAEGIPNWLLRIRERQKEEIQPAGVQEEDIEAVEEAVPDWINRLREEDALASAQPAEEALPEEQPVPETAVAETAAEEGIPDWLKQLETEAAAQPPDVETAPEPEEAAPEPLPDWLVAPAAAIATAPAQPEPVLPEGEDVELEALLAQPAPVEVSEEEALEEVAAEVEPTPPVEQVADEVAAEAASEPVMEEVAAEAETAPPVEPFVEEVAAEAPPEPAAEPILEEVAGEAVAPEQLLDQARKMRDGADADRALDLYEQLIQDGNLLDKVLADLESGAAGPLSQTRTHTLIGDLCMKQDRLQKALESYRRALDFLKQ